MFETFIVINSVFGFRDDESPVSVVGVDQILDFKPDSGLQSFIFPVFKEIVANFVGVVEINDFIALFVCLIFKVVFGLFGEVNHKFVHHVAHDFDVLIVYFLL